MLPVWARISDCTPEVFAASVSTLASLGATVQAFDGSIRLTKQALQFNSLTTMLCGKHLVVVALTVCYSNAPYLYWPHKRPVVLVVGVSKSISESVL